jgi:hypothetical protein
VDLERAIEAGARAVADESIDVDRDDCRLIIDAAVRAAAPLIEQAALSEAVDRVEATFITGARPDWLEVGAKPTASVIREWVKRTILGAEGGP